MVQTVVKTVCKSDPELEIFNCEVEFGAFPARSERIQNLQDELAYIKRRVAFGSIVKPEIKPESKP